MTNYGSVPKRTIVKWSVNYQHYWNKNKNMEYDTNFGEYKRRQKLGISPLIFTHLVAMFVGFSIAMTVVLSFID